MARTAWGSISREQIIDTAVGMLRAEGYHAVTIRSLAREMGVAPMSLYRHIRDKDDIFDEVVERLQAGKWKPRGRGGDWKAWISDAADRLRRFLVSEPAALHVYLSHPVVSPSAVARMEAIMDVLRSQLKDEAAARHAYGAIQTYTIGFAALEASRAGWSPSDGAVDPLAQHLAAYTTPKQFATGLRYLLDGVDARIER